MSSGLSSGSDRCGGIFPFVKWILDHLFFIYNITSKRSRRGGKKWFCFSGFLPTRFFLAVAFAFGHVINKCHMSPVQSQAYSESRECQQCFFHYFLGRKMNPPLSEETGDDVGAHLHTHFHGSRRRTASWIFPAKIWCYWWWVPRGRKLYYDAGQDFRGILRLKLMVFARKNGTLYITRIFLRFRERLKPSFKKFATRPPNEGGETDVKIVPKRY